MAHTVYGISHLVLPTGNLERSLAFWRDRVGFSVLDEGETWTDLEAGTLRLRLAVGATASPVTVHLEVGDLAAACEGVQGSDARLLEEARSQDDVISTQTADPDGNSLILWRHLTEDELASPPELETHREWTEEARVVAQQILLAVPAMFRGRARERLVREAERLAGSACVDRHLVGRSYVRVTPRIMRPRTRGPLAEAGFDPEDFSDDYEDVTD